MRKRDRAGPLGSPQQREGFGAEHKRSEGCVCFIQSRDGLGWKGPGDLQFQPLLRAGMPATVPGCQKSSVPGGWIRAEFSIRSFVAFPTAGAATFPSHLCSVAPQWPLATDAAGTQREVVSEGQESLSRELGQHFPRSRAAEGAQEKDVER